AELRLRQAAIVLGFGDRERAWTALAAAQERLRGVDGDEAERLRGELKRARAEVVSSAGAPAETESPPTDEGDPATATATPTPTPTATSTATATATATDDPLTPRGTLALFPAAPAPAGGFAASAFEEALAAARATLFSDLEALDSLALCAHGFARESGPAARRAAVLGRSAEGLAAFARAEAPPSGTLLPLRVDASARGDVLPGAAGGPAAQLLALLAPWLETLFPADLARRGISGHHRVGAQRAPEVAALLDSAHRAVATRPFAAFLSEEGGCAIGIENTQPPSLVISAGFTRAPPAVRRSLAARALALLDLGATLPGKFAPSDFGTLLELACRFAGGDPPPLGLPARRAPAFLDALARTVPPTARARAEALAPAAAAELASLAPRDLATALRHGATRIALLHAGDAHAAAAALLAGERRVEVLALPRALEHGDLLDLAAFALSERYAELRSAGEEPA
ncbi:MAG: hypothetical protein ACJ79R_10985, partial [Anaeromyxobacteraceae bacterium]